MAIPLGYSTKSKADLFFICLFVFCILIWVFLTHRVFFLISTVFYKQEKSFRWEKQKEKAPQALEFLDNVAEMWVKYKEKNLWRKNLAFHNAYPCLL